MVGGLVFGYNKIMNIDLRVVLIAVAVVILALAGFGFTEDHEHYHHFDLALAAFFASFLPLTRDRNRP